MDLGFFLGNPEAAASFFANLVYASPFGMPGLFIFTIFANASIVLPILVEPIIFLIATLAPNIYFAAFVGIITGIAAAIGEMSGYILGLFGIKTLQKMSRKRIEKIFEIGEKLAEKGMPIIFVGALTPFPFDLIGIAAGIIKYDPKKFFIAAMAGKVVRYTLVALVGFLGKDALPWVASVLGL